MRFNIAPWLERYPWLKRAQDVAVFARRRAHDVEMAQVAGSLTFTTLLAIVPLFAIGLALFSVFPLFAEFRGAVENAVLKALPGQISVTVLRYINEFALKATQLTTVGVVFLAVTSIAMMVTVDRVLNDIWRVKDRRSFGRRVFVYWAILTLGPLLIGASLTTSTYLWSLSGDAIAQLPAIVRGVLDYAPAVISGFAYAALYVFVPNRTVAWRDALIGGFVAAILAEVLRRSFGVFVSSGTTGSVYGAFAALPLFLMWVYLNWYVLLFGAAVSATLPRLRATRFSDELRAGNQFLTAVALLKLLLEAKHGKKPAMPPSALARQIRTSVDETELLLEALATLGYIRQLADTDSGRRGEQDWLLTGDENAMTLKSAFDHFAIDPANTLINVETLGLRALRARWFQSEWLTAPLADVLSGKS